MRKKVTLLVFSALCSLIVLSSVAIGGEDFLSVSEYWKRPVPLQRNSNFFYPEECGKCHKSQYGDWKDSLHSKAVGPGLLGQLTGTDLKSIPNDPQFAQSCYFCHAPMEEQAEMIENKSGVRGLPPQALSGGQESEKDNYIKNPNFDNKLKLSGVSCAVCHLREGKIYGPPLRKGKGQGARGKGSGEKSQISNLKSQIKDAHDGFIEKDFFEKAEFCAACHQLDEGYELNGKVLTNTYREWKKSIYSKNNITCQNCHMPDRQHLFRGIHDPEMVKRGITINAVREGSNARLVITNTGVGHFFPTYVTPVVVIKGFMLDKNDKVIARSMKKAFIGRKVNLDLSKEIFDTRIPPEKSFEFDYTVSKSYNSGKLVFEVWVYPDEFYNRFYRDLLKGKNGGFDGKEIEKAFKITEKSGYRLFREIL